MVKKNTNLLLEQELLDIFDKDPEEITREERDKIVKYYQDLAASWNTTEDTKATNKAKKEMTVFKDLDEVESTTF